MLEAELYDSEDETLEDLYDGEDDADAEADLDDGEALLNMAAGDGGDDATEDGDDDSATEESDEDEEDDDEDDEEEDDEPSLDLGLTEEPPPPASERESSAGSRSLSTPPSPAPSPPRKRSLSPAHLRRKSLAFALDRPPRSFTVEAICAIPHPVPTHALASSACMTHLLTGSDDGYIRDYDIFAAVNSKNFLTAPQRHHSGVVEGLMKSGQLRFWWENPMFQDASRPGILSGEEEPSLAPVYSLAMHSDALWALAGTDAGYINLFTLRHEPGRLCHVMDGHHRSPVSALCLDYDEKGFLALQWDLNTGQNVRNFTAHNAQLTSVAVRPMSSYYVQTVHRYSGGRNQSGSDGMDIDPVTESKEPTDAPNMLFGDQTEDMSQPMPADSDARSDASFDPLFDDLPSTSTIILPRNGRFHDPPPKGAPPLIDPTGYQTYSPEILMTAFIDGHTKQRTGVGRLWMNEKTPPWCLSACWSTDGAQIYAGRRNGTVDVWDVRALKNTPASVDNIRLWNVAESGEDGISKSRSGVQFKIIPGHHGGYISQMSIVDAGARFLVSASSNRGLHGDSTRTVFVHDIKRVD
ncbi:WD40-repeat-containing domain protein [Flammula alnicola]|nr:WD40-repeat-containing domain protein [Flammula alnicola]